MTDKVTEWQHISVGPLSAKEAIADLQSQIDIANLKAGKPTFIGATVNGVEHVMLPKALYDEWIAAQDEALNWADANARWFDISTAPRDGTRVLVKGPWTDKDGEYITENYVWRGEKWTITYMTEYGEPTHWRPIQNPPLGQLPEPLERLGEVLRRVKNV